MLAFEPNVSFALVNVYSSLVVYRLNRMVKATTEVEIPYYLGFVCFSCMVVWGFVHCDFTNGRTVEF